MYIYLFICVIFMEGSCVCNTLSTLIYNTVITTPLQQRNTTQHKSSKHITTRKHPATYILNTPPPTHTQHSQLDILKTTHIQHRYNTTQHNTTQHSNYFISQYGVIPIRNIPQGGFLLNKHETNTVRNISSAFSYKHEHEHKQLNAILSPQEIHSNHKSLR